VSDKKETCHHETPRKLPYMADQADARRRMKRGETQKFCPVCERWIWHSWWRKKGET
jgi:hypothetical protein